MQLQYIASVRYLAHFQIFQSVPLTGTISFDALAKQTRLSVQSLKTVMRLAMTSNLFCEPELDQVAHSATSALLVTKPELHDWAIFLTETTAPSAFKLVEATEKWPEAFQKNETAYNVAFDTDLPFFEHLNTNPRRVQEFAGYMKNVQQSEGTSLRHLVQGFDWAALGKGTVVDVSGHRSFGSFPA